MLSKVPASKPSLSPELAHCDGLIEDGAIGKVDRMLEKALDTLVNGDFNARWQAAKVIKTYGEQAHGSLISLAESNFHDPDLQGFIVGILGKNPTPDILLTLIKILKESTDEDLRETIVLTLGKQGPKNVDSLLQFATQRDLQPAVVRALVQINHPCTIDGLLRFVSHDDSRLRSLALEALGQFHGELITNYLFVGLQDVDPRVRSVCVKALGLRRMAERNETLVTKVSVLLYDSNTDVCQLAARTLGRLDHPLALEYLWHRLIEQSTPTPLTQSLIQALGWSSHPNGVSYLLKLLTVVSAAKPDIQIGVPWSLGLVNELIQTLANLSASDQVSKIELLLTGLLSCQTAPFPEVQVQQQIIRAIALLKQDRSIPILIRALAIEDDRIRFHLIAALKQINAHLSQETLALHNQDLDLDPKLKAGIAIALKEW